MILIKNTQHKISANTDKIKKDVDQMLHLLNYQDFDIGIWLTTNQTIRKYNFMYRKKNKATDILSFPYHTSLKPGQRIKITTEEDKNLGDIIISLEFALNDASKLKQSLSKHLKMLLAHGITHLLGFDHKTDEEYIKMQKVEQKLLKSIK